MRFLILFFSFATALYILREATAPNHPTPDIREIISRGHPNDGVGFRDDSTRARN